MQSYAICGAMHLLWCGRSIIKPLVGPNCHRHQGLNILEARGIGSSPRHTLLSLRSRLSEPPQRQQAPGTEVIRLAEGQMSERGSVRPVPIPKGAATTSTLGIQLHSAGASFSVKSSARNEKTSRDTLSCRFQLEIPAPMSNARFVRNPPK